METGENRNQENYNADIFLTLAIVINTSVFGRTQKPDYLSLEVFFKKGPIWNHWEKTIRKKRRCIFLRNFSNVGRIPREVNSGSCMRAILLAPKPKNIINTNIFGVFLILLLINCDIILRNMILPNFCGILQYPVSQEEAIF